MKIVNMLLAGTFLLGVTAIAMSQERGAGSRPAGLRGSLVKVDGTTLIIKERARGGEGKEVKVATGEKTAYTVDGKSGKISDLKEGMMLTITPETGTAENVRATTPGLMGMVDKVDGKNVMLKTRAPGGGEAKDVTVATDDKTVVYIDGKSGKLEDLKQGMMVNVLPKEGTATSIEVLGMGGGGRGPRNGGGARGGAGQ